MAEVVQDTNKNVWLQFVADEPLTDVDEIADAIEKALARFEDRLNIIPTHIVLHDSVPEELAMSIADALGVNTARSPVLPYDTMYAVGIPDGWKASAISSHINMMWYEEYEGGDAGLGDLYVEFNPKMKADGTVVNGKTYKYGYVHDYVYAKLLAAESKGRAFNEHVAKGGYDHEEVESRE